VDTVASPQRYGAIGEQQKQALRSTLLAWLQSKTDSQADEPPFIKNKFAQLIVAVIARDYPQHWLQIFAQLLNMLPSGPFFIDMFLRVLNTIHEDVVSAEGSGYNPEMANRVKDGMRENCMPQIADAWYSILQLHGTAPSLVASCLNTLSQFVSWVDITLVTHERFMRLLVPFMRTPALHEGACGCLTEIVVKRMDATLKLEHLARLQMISLLSEAASSGVELSVKFSTLVSSLALEVLDSWDKIRSRSPVTPELTAQASQAADGVVRCMPLLLSCLASTDLEVSQCTMAFLHSYVGRLRKLASGPKEIEAHEPHLRHLLLALAQKSVYPDEYNFDEEEEDEKAFIAFRKELSTLFKGVARVHLSLAQEFVRSTLQSTLASPSVPWAHLEVALWLLYTLGEGLPDAAIREKGGFFQEMMVATLQSRASSYPHQAIQPLFLEIVVRFYRFFVAQPQYLPTALRSFLDERGMYNSNAAVRQRACYLLLRFVKQTLKSTTASFVEVVNRLLEILSQQPTPQHELSSAPSSSTPPRASPLQNGGSQNGRPTGELGAAPRLSEAEQLSVFETCGLLLGAGIAPVEQVRELLSGVLDLPSARLRLLCSLGASPPHGIGDSSEVAQLLSARAATAAHQIALMAVLSKGFVNLSADDNGQSALRETFSHAAQLALAALTPFGSSVEVRTKTLMLLHRMVETLDASVVDYFQPSLPQLLASAEAREVCDIVTLVNQLVLKFKAKIYAPIAQVVGPLISSLFGHLAALDAAIANSSSATVGAAGPQSDEVRERHGLLRAFFSLVHSLVHSDLTAVLSAPENAAHMAPSMAALSRGCVEGPDMQIQRQCFGILQKLVEAWGGTGAGALPGFNSYILQEMLPLCFQAPSQPHVDLKNAAALLLLEAIAALQIAMLAKIGNEFISYVCERQLPSLGASAELINDYGRLLAERDANRLRDYLRQQLSAGRSL